ncbi:MAG: site-specific integrase [Methylomonas sp.]|nr:site-specific integrase [Methylomonas sp.]
MPEHLYCRGGTWYAHLRVRGRLYRRSLRTSNKTTAKRRLKKILEEASHLRFHGEARHGWKHAVVRWAQEYPAQVKPAAMKRYLVSVRQLDPFFGGAYLDEITRRRIADYVSDRKKAATNATIRRDLTALSRILACCVAWGWLETNPAREFDRTVLRERRDPIVPPSDDDVAWFLTFCPKNFANAVQFLRQTGMRAEEGFSLEHGQCDLKRHEILLPRTKTNRPRVIPLADPLLSDAGITLSITQRHLASPFVFWHGDGNRYCNVASRFAEIMRRAEQGAIVEKRPFQRFRCHDLRHKFAVEYLKGGGDIYALARILGHSSVKTTEIYLAYTSEGISQKVSQQRRFSGTGDGEAPI